MKFRNFIIKLNFIYIAKKILKTNHINLIWNKNVFSKNTYNEIKTHKIF